MDRHIRVRAHQTRERQAKLASVNKQLDSLYTSLSAAPSGLDSTLYSRDDRAQNQSDNHLMIHQEEGISADTYHTRYALRESVEDVWRD